MIGRWIYNIAVERQVPACIVLLGILSLMACGCVLSGHSGILVYDPVTGKAITNIYDRGPFREGVLNTWPTWNYFYTLNRADGHLIIRKRDAFGRVIERWPFPYYTRFCGEKSFITISEDGAKFLFYKREVDGLYLYNKDTGQISEVITNITFGLRSEGWIRVRWNTDRCVVVLVEPIGIPTEPGEPGFGRKIPLELVDPESNVIVARLLWLDIEKGLIREQRVEGGCDSSFAYELSPHGNYLAKIQKDGAWVDIFDTHTMKVVNRVRKPRDMEVIFRTSWVDENKLLIECLRTTTSGGERKKADYFVLFEYNRAKQKLIRILSYPESVHFKGVVGPYVICGYDGGIFTIGKRAWIIDYATGQRHELRRIVGYGVQGICGNKRLVMEVGF